MICWTANNLLVLFRPPTTAASQVLEFEERHQELIFTLTDTTTSIFCIATDSTKHEVTSSTSDQNSRFDPTIFLDKSFRTWETRRYIRASDAPVIQLAFNGSGLQSHDLLPFLVKPDNIILRSGASVVYTKYSRLAVSSFLHSLEDLFIMSPRIKILGR